MNKTNIIVTIGPTTNTKEMIKRLISSGVSVFRINLNYMDHNFCEDVINKIRDVDNELGTVTAIMFDTVGPDIKTGNFINGKANFKEGMKIRVYNYPIIGDETKLYIDYYDLINGINYNTTIKLNNGKVVLNVLDKESNYLLCEVMTGGEVIDNSSVHIADELKMPFLSNKDIEDIKFADKMNIDFLALSLVSCSEDVLNVNDLLIELGNDHMSIISKIEKESAVSDIDDIIRVSDGVMLTRGDLGVEIPIERIPGIQKMVINKCHVAGKISIVATEVMSSMEHSLIPSRAEVSDVATSVLEGVDAITLSLETMKGSYPLEVVDMIKKVIITSENDINYFDLIDRASRTENNDTTGILAHSVTSLAAGLKCKAIVTPTITGYTAKKMSRFRPNCPIIAISPDINTVKSLKLYFGIYPILINELKSLDNTIEKSKEIVLNHFDLFSGDKIVITGGYPFRKVKHTNFIKIEEI
ncbi:MAG: pyruvate kinase [Bacilli bacterium]|nr:pyruvate kinase [Bacilli bacterium]